MDEKKLPDRDAKPEEKDEFEQMLQTMVVQGCLWYLNRCEEFLLTEDAWGDKLPLWATAAEAEYNCTQGRLHRGIDTAGRVSGAVDPVSPQGKYRCFYRLEGRRGLCSAA